MSRSSFLVAVYELTTVRGWVMAVPFAPRVSSQPLSCSGPGPASCSGSCLDHGLGLRDRFFLGVEFFFSSQSLRLGVQGLGSRIQGSGLTGRVQNLARSFTGRVHGLARRLGGLVRNGRRLVN